MASLSHVPCPYCANPGRLFSVHGLRVHIGRMHKDISQTNTVGLLASQPLTSTTVISSNDINDVKLSDLPTLKAKVRVLRHIPKGARYLAAGKLASIINQCLQSNSTADWVSLLTFAFTALRIPDQSGKESLTSKVKANIDVSQVGVPMDSAPRRSPSLYKLVEAKVFEGDLRGAARLLTSDCSYARPSEETSTALRDKHPSPSRPSQIPPAPDISDACLIVEARDVSEALYSFPKGSAAGMDGLRPEHLQELVSPSAGDNGPKLLDSLTRLSNFLLEGRLNMEICPFLYGGSLCALQKKDGGVRPIAVGSSIRRLVAKLCCHAVRGSMASYLQPHQVGFGTPRGCEAAIHATRNFAMRDNSNDVLIKLDIRNAFNSVERDIILSEVRTLTPLIYPFLYQCYSSFSNLSYNGECILSQVGAQQGDPLGPLVFSLAIHKIIASLESPLNIWYLDDGTIGGSPETVERDVRKLFPALKELGLEVNTAKCEMFPCSLLAAESCSRFESLIPGLKIMDRASLSLLGAPIFCEGLKDCMQEKTNSLENLTDCLKNLPAHVAVTLLKVCFAMPKMTYVIRTAPTWKFPEEVSRFDNTLKQVLEEILNVQMNQSQWYQASLPIRHGGLGIRRLQETGPCAFLASSNGVAELVTKILSSNGDMIRIPFVEEALGMWSILCPNASPPVKPQLQKNWDDLVCRQSVSQIRDECSGVDLARLNAVIKPESGAWLQALPSPHMGTLLDDDSLRVAVALRLGCTVCEPHVCICGAKVEADGHHALSCTRCSGRRPRHLALNEILKRALVSAEVPCVLEPPGLSRSDGKRPDGLTLVPWQRGRCLVWDATCVSTFASCHLSATQQIAGGGAEAAARAKHQKYACLGTCYDFVPFAVETAGPWGREARKLVQDLGRRLKDRGRDPRSGWFLTQQISLAIQRGNAASILGTFERRKCD